MDTLNIQLDKIHRYTEQNDLHTAKALMESIVNQYPEQEELKVRLAILEILTGYPHQALTRIQSVDKQWSVDYEIDIESIEQSLVHYEHLYDQYNKALDHISSNVSTAYHIVNISMLTMKEYPIPVEIYATYISLCVLELGEEKALEELDQCPQYVKLSSELQSIAQDIEVSRYKQEVLSNDKRNKIRARFWLGSVAILVISLIIAIGLLVRDEPQLIANDDKNTLGQEHAIGEDDIKQPAADEYGGLLQVEEEIKRLKDELQLTKEAEQSVSAQFTLVQEQAQQYMTTLDLLKVAGTSLDDMLVEAAEQSYTKGMKEYRKKNYESAIVLLKNSVDISKLAYYSDDSMYFLIHSLLSSNNELAAIDMYEQFIAEQSESFMQSPYRDDVLLELAAIFMSNSQDEKAKPLLNEIIEHYADQWTAGQARLMLLQIEH